MNKHSGVPEVTVDEHKALINSLDDCQYIYMFDGRFRVAVVFDCFESSYSILVCSSSGKWFCVDSFYNCSELEYSMFCCIKAVVSFWNDGDLDSDLKVLVIGGKYSHYK